MPKAPATIWTKIKSFWGYRGLKKGVKWGKIWLKICPISYKVTSKTLNIRYRSHRWTEKCNMVTTYIIDHNQLFLGTLGGVEGGQKGQKGVKTWSMSYKVTSKTLTFRYRSHRWIARWHMVTTFIIDHNQPFWDTLGAIDGGQKGRKGVKTWPMSYKVTSKTLTFRYRSHRWIARWHMVTTFNINHNQPFWDTWGAIDGGQKGEKG